ncbi:RIP metalloprotease RseP [Duganella sp. Root1480D1]|uniref:RIP metalloprotease RseP n=1 Tax=Duganella sp. Root1480D1 TaxID=1736471 RepID=UPI00070D5BC1|nr:RIP metalloprotease RseP [Duganella sp. Root1480D1]KQZ32420.1 RIP metalloprotease RseP [Duganella sp. Root1480D1]
MDDAFRTILATIVCLGSLIIIHELGHYLVARWCGVKVLRFSVGMGRIVWMRRFGKDQTEWAISAIPLGGYVKMLDAREQDVSDLPAEDLAREFTRQNVWKRIAIVAAGPLANFLLAIALYAGLYMSGVREPAARIAEPAQATAAAAAGLHRGDLVKSVNGEPVQGWSELRWAIIQSAIHKEGMALVIERPGYGKLRVALPAEAAGQVKLEDDVPAVIGLELMRPPPVIGIMEQGGAAQRAGMLQGDVVVAVDGQQIEDDRAFVAEVLRSPGRKLVVTVLRDGRQQRLELTPDAVEDKQANSKGLVTVGKIKAALVGPVDTIVVHYGPLDAVAKATRQVKEICTMTVRILGRMITLELSPKHITGVLTIAQYAGETAKMGAEPFIAFVAFISVSLGLMNLLPIPVLDGGHLLYYSLEVLTGRPVSERFGEMAQRIGLGLLVSLMALAIFNDLVRLL